jgi:hypothetical protein
MLAAFHIAVLKLPENSIKLSNLEDDVKEFKKLVADDNNSRL